MSTAEAPKRASASTVISIGLLSIPLDLYTGTENIAIARSQFLPDGTVVGSAPCVKISDGVYGDKVDKDQIVKRYQTTSGLVELTDAEIDACSTAVRGTADVVAVHSLDMLRDGSYLTNGKIWQVRAAKLGTGRTAVPNPGGQQALVLLLRTLEALNSFMLLRWSRAGSVYVSALLPSGQLVGLYHDEEIRAERELPFSDLAIPAEQIALAGQLLSAFTKTERVELRNESIAAVAAYAEEKAKNGTVIDVSAPAAAPQAQVVDMMATLRASVAAVQAEAPAPPAVAVVPSEGAGTVAPKKKAPRKKAAPAAA
jgi:non-homologous end joining protein Ku